MNVVRDNNAPSNSVEATQRRNYNAVQTLLAHGAEVDCKEPQSGWILRLH